MSEEISKLKKRKNIMLRETIGSFGAPLYVYVVLLFYDWSILVKTIFISVVAIITPFVGLLFLRAYLKAKKKYEESLKSGDF